MPILFHVGGEEKLNPAYFENGMPRVKDFHGGERTSTSVSFMPIPNSVMQTLACLIIDGVMDRFQGSKFGAIELGSVMGPELDAVHGFRPRRLLQERGAAAQAFGAARRVVRRQVRVTPYPHEQSGWIIANSGPEVCLFSSDFPHVEGGRNPLKRFNDALEGTRAEGGAGQTSSTARTSST